ncbi:MAG: virulence RhuM family protein [Bacilli bacterium]|jgi:hypothetical protein|nr:virulence RhuM family protein [Bacilli bacterium]
MKNEIIRFVNGSLSLDVAVSENHESVWLTLDQMAALFQSSRSTISYHVSNVFKEKELDFDTSVEKFDRTLKNASRPPLYYNLDVIISVGYRVHSSNGVAFRKWATNVLKNYMVRGYAVNEKRLAALQRTISVQNAFISCVFEKAGVDSEEILSVIY